ncbi:MAG: nuclear transport factor 2 family protein [Actinomycetales bacterium]|nr:nuclear transport factor 2 family protein [Actinomycetales bacterium]
MRKTSALVFAGLLMLVAVGGCAASTGSAVDRAEQLQSQLVDAWLAGDVDAQLALTADDVTFENKAHDSYAEGRDAFASVLRDVASITDHEATELVRSFVSADGTTGVVEYHWVGEAPDQGPFDLTMLNRFTFADGKLASVTLYWAEPDAADQLLG